VNPPTRIAVLLAASIAGCALVALKQVPPGTPATEVQARAGAPTEKRALADGVKAWYYISGPLGWTTYRARFDVQDRLLDVDQVLTEAHFRALKEGKTSRSDVLQMLGSPALVMRYPNLGEEVWTYRYMDVTLEMLNDDHFDAASGVLKYYTLYRDPSYASVGSH